MFDRQHDSVFNFDAEVIDSIVFITPRKVEGVLPQDREVLVLDQSQITQMQANDIHRQVFISHESNYIIIIHSLNRKNQKQKWSTLKETI